MTIDQITQPARLELPLAAGMTGLEPLRTIRRRWPAILGAALTAAMLVGLGRELLASGLRELAHSIPRNPWFWLAFAGLYVAPPLFDYLIFRRLWDIPLSGFAALIKKRIANDVVMGYSGEAYFYAWARQRAHLVASPFGAVKDVSILSAIAGNAVTLAMMVLALAVGRALIPAEMVRYVYGSVAVMIGTSLPFLLFSRRVFTLPRRQLWFVFRMHVARLLLGALFLALAWHFALPGVAIATWLFLSAGRLLFSRLPLLPNKDLLFANFAILVIGRGSELSELIALVAALMLVVHLALVLIFAAVALTRRSRPA